MTILVVMMVALRLGDQVFRKRTDGIKPLLPVCKELDKAVKEFRTRPSEGGLSVSYGGCYIDDYRDVAGWNRYNRETLFYTLESVGSIPPLVLSFS